MHPQPCPSQPRRTAFFFFQAEDGIRDYKVTGVQTCALPILSFPSGGMEQHAAVADWSPPPDGKLTLWSATQTPHYVHRALAKVLELPAARIRVIACPNGGGFGGKSDPFSHEIVAAKLAMLTGRPVKITLTREEVFYCHRGRHPTLMWV